MRAVFSLALLLPVATLFGCSSSREFGEGFSQGWQANNVTVAWESRIGDVTAAQGMQVVGDQLCVSDRSGGIYMLDVATGKETGRASISEPLAASGACSRRRIAMVLESGQMVVANPADGAVEWRTNLNSRLLGQPLLVGNSLIVIQTNGEVISYSYSTGDLLWQLELPSSSFRFASFFTVATSPERLAFGMPEGTFYSIETVNGIIAWQSRLYEERDPDPTASVTAIAGASFKGDHVCAAAFNGSLACFDNLTGSRLWSEEISSAGTVASNGTQLFFVDNVGTLQARSIADGALLWESPNASSNRSPLVFVEGGRVIVDNGFAGLSVFSAESGELIGGVNLNGRVVDYESVRRDLAVLTSSGTIYRLSFQS